jgi:hypothetical protein
MFARIDIQIQASAKQIKTLNKSGIDTTDIKYQFLRSLILLIVSEYETIIEKMFILRASKCKDPHLVNFIKSQIDKKFRSPDLSKISGTLGAFDSKLKEAFQKNTINLPMHTAWDNVMRARHFIVHKQGSLNLTYEELLTTYPETKKILIEIAKLLKIKRREIAAN